MNNRTRGAVDPTAQWARVRTDNSGNQSERLQKDDGEKTRIRKPSILIPLFFISLVLPITMYAGSLRLSPYRILLIALFVPNFVAWISGSMGKVRSPDVLILLFCIWAFIALTANHGIEVAFQPSGILLVETFGTYLLARRLVNDAKSFRTFVLSLFWIVVILLPFALYETATGYNITLGLFDKFFHTFPDVSKERRWGLDRVQGPFEHPILFGVFCSAGFALAYYSLGQGLSFFKRAIRTVPSALGTFLSLSSGPLSALTAQMFIIGWDLALKRVKERWKILFALFAAAYVAIDTLSNRSPFAVLLSYFAFNASSAYTRVFIWEYGTADALRHPLFGIGFNKWQHGPGMTDSMDMFWLVNAVVYGLPAALFFTLAFLVVLFQLGRLKTTDPKIAEYRTGLVITVVGISLAGWTVDFWNATYVLLIFLIGSGVWMLDHADQSQAEPLVSSSTDNPETPIRRTGFTRESGRDGR